ncbi:MAG: hypothetical protein KME47_10110 [Nodosilinea sp. WJT8-NPBG4]|jgi:hypothetical protein|nr:hypothetical protein [Nodosilinea sp. WJT8-NPBG4]
MSAPSVYSVTECEKAIKQLIESHGVSAVKESLVLCDPELDVTSEVEALKAMISSAANELGYW